MTAVDVVFAALKILVILGFLVNMGGLLTWVERRQMAMIQDRVGPNRAVVYLPGKLAQGALYGLGALLLLGGLGGIALAVQWKSFALGVGAGALLLGGGGVLAVAARLPIDEQGWLGLRLAGLLHPLADGLKFIFKEDFIPPNADKLLHSLAPMISLFPAFVTFAVIPFGDVLCVRLGEGTGLAPLLHATLPETVPRYGVCAEHGVGLQLASLDVGILYMFALAGTGIIGAAIAGWSSDNKFSLLGGLRAASQMVSYEVAMGLSLVGAFMTYGTVRLEEMVRWQSEHAWGVFIQPFALLLFMTAAIAENKRVPFDAPEGESEIVAGYLVEYSGMKFSMFYLGEYCELAISSAVVVTVFLGGWAVPFVHRDGLTVAFGDTVLFHQPLLHGAVVLLGMLTFFGKTILFTWFQVFIRWTLPRFRYDQIMKLGWRMLLPLSLANMMATAVLLLAIDAGGAGLASGLQLVGDVSQAIVILVHVVAAVWFVRWAVSPVRHERNGVGTSARYAAAAGGVKASPMQA